MVFGLFFQGVDGFSELSWVERNHDPKLFSFKFMFTELLLRSMTGCLIHLCCPNLFLQPCIFPKQGHTKQRQSTAVIYDINRNIKKTHQNQEIDETLFLL